MERLLINTKNLNEARKSIDRAFNEKKQIIVLAQNPDFNRKILENKKVSILLSPELTEPDKIKQRGSGLNEILAKIAAKNNISIGIDINEILKKQDKERAILLARVMQNIKLCKRTKTKIIVFPKIKDKGQKKAVFSFFLTLGASTQQADKATAC